MERIMILKDNWLARIEANNGFDDAFVVGRKLVIMWSSYLHDKGRDSIEIFSN